MDKETIRQRLLDEGFDAVGFTVPAAVGDAAAGLSTYLASGHHGDMAWMVRPERDGPEKLWPEVRSIIMAAMNYGPDHDPMDNLKNRMSGNISIYARNRNYHDVIKGRLKTVAGWMAARTGKPVKVFTDTAPIMEKPLAHAAGVGWQGKHTNLVSRTYGSWLFLGEIFTTLDLSPDSSEVDHCGSCRACLDICPTNAFPAPYRFDARRCISYLTIELKTQIPVEFREPMGNRIYGCDDCLAVCPWNKFAATARESRFQARADLSSPALADLARLDDGAFRRLFAGSPVKRTGRDRFVRNVLVAIGNSGDAALVPLVKDLLLDDSALVRGMAVWALAQLASGEEFNRLRADRLDKEQDPDVQAEWTTS